jgi:hypothetical protein
MHSVAKAGILLLLLVTGLPACDWNGDWGDYCGGSRYIDVEGVELRAFREPFVPGSQPLPAGQSIRFSELRLQLNLQQKRWSAAPTRGGFRAWADCSDPENDEAVDSLTITSRYDYDARHPAGTSLNDLVLVVPMSGAASPGTAVTLQSLFQHAPFTVLHFPVGWLALTAAPAQPGPQQFRVRYHQTNGEVYQADTPLLTVQP